MSTMIGPAELEVISKLLKTRHSKLETLATELNRSERRLRYSLEKLNEFFQRYYAENLIAVDGQYVELLKSAEVIDSAIANIDKRHYYMSQEERIELSSFHYLVDQNLTIDELADFMNISLSTLKQTMMMVRDRLKKYNISLVNVHKVGLQATGEEKNIRKGLVSYIYRNFDLICHAQEKRVLLCFETNPYFKKILKGYLAGVPIQKLIEILDQYEARYTTFKNDEYYKLALAELVVIYKRSMAGQLLDGSHDLNPLDNIKATFLHDEFINKLNTVLPKGEFLGFIRNTDDISAANFVPLNILLTDMLNKLIEKHLKGERPDLSNPRIVEAIGILNRHFQYSINRIRKDVLVENPLLRDIKESHETLFNDIRTLLSDIEEYAGRTFSENEIGYFTILIENIFSIIQTENKRVKNVVVVCGIGYGASQLLTNKIKRYFKVNVVDVIPYHKLRMISAVDVDLIISTLPLARRIKDIAIAQVSPLMSDADLEILRNAGLMREKVFTPDSILDIINRHCVVTDREKLTNELALLLNGGTAVPKNEKNDSLLDYLRNNILLNQSVSDWQEAVKIAGSLLLKNSSIDLTYVLDMIQNIKTFGPYMVVGDCLLPHAENKENVFKTDFSLVTLTNPVKLAGDKSVSTIFCFSSVDGIGHIKTLIDFMDLIENGNLLTCMSRFKQTEEFLRFIENKNQ